MRHQNTSSKVQELQNLSADQVCALVEKSGLTPTEVCERVGCGTSQLFKYQKEGLPPRMNRRVRAALLQLGMETGVLPANALVRASVAKLSKGTA